MMKCLYIDGKTFLLSIQPPQFENPITKTGPVHLCDSPSAYNTSVPLFGVFAGGFIFRIEHGKPKNVPEIDTTATSQIILIDEPRKNVSDVSLTYLSK